MTAQTRILALFGSAILYGAERGNIEALAALKDGGAEVLCIIRTESRYTLVPLALEARGFRCRRMPYIEHPQPGRSWQFLVRNPFAFLIANWKFLRLVQEFEPTHIHAYGQLFVLNFLLGLSLVRTPMIFRAGDEPTVHNWVWRATWRFVVNRTSRFVANAEFVARSLRDHGVPPDKIAVIYNIPPARTLARKTPFDREVPAGARVLCFVGQIQEHKGPHILISAFKAIAARFPDLHLLVAGRISSWAADAWARELRKQTQADPVIGSRVIFLGETEDVPNVITRSEAVVAPSLFADPAPNVVMEAKAAGRAAIVFPNGGLPELVENEVDGLICGGANAQALEIALEHFLSDPALAGRYGAAARASQVRFGTAQFGSKWRAIYGIVPNVGAMTDIMMPNLRQDETLA